MTVLTAQQRGLTRRLQRSFAWCACTLGVLITITFIEAAHAQRDKPTLRSEGDYAALVARTDLSTRAGLQRWSAATGITVIALSRNSNFFYYNAHLLADASAYNNFDSLSELQSRFDEERQGLVVSDARGAPLTLRALDRDPLYTLSETARRTHYSEFETPKLQLGALRAYIAKFESIPHRKGIAAALAKLPFNMVKALHGTALYLSTQQGRSYAITGPISNRRYPLFAGFIPGVFLEATSPSQTPKTLIHELCHVIDHVVLESHYGGVYFPRQYPRFQALRNTKAALFGSRGDSVTQSDYGYISRYAQANAQENFAEHCMAAIWEEERFALQAKRERSLGHPQLQRKLDFLKQLLWKTPPETVALSDYLASLVDALPDETPPPPDSGVSAATTADCRAGLRDTRKLRAALSEALGAPVRCAVTRVQRVNLAQRRHYYTGMARCRADADASPAALKRLRTLLHGRQFSGYGYAASANRTAVSGPVSSQVCANP